MHRRSLPPSATRGAEPALDAALDAFENPRVAVIEAALQFDVASREEIGLKILDDHGGDWGISRNSLYAYLKDLVAHGLMEMVPPPSGAHAARLGRGRPTTFYFRVTPRGRSLYDTWKEARLDKFEPPLSKNTPVKVER